MVELLLATVRPWQLMAGKVLGIGVIGLRRWCSSSVRARGRRSRWGSSTPRSSTCRHDRTLGGHLVRRRLHHVRAGAGRPRGAGVPAGGRRLGDRAGLTLMMSAVHHRREHRAVGPDEPAGGRAVVHPVLRAAAHADPDRPRRGRAVGGRPRRSGCRSRVIPVLVWLAGRIYSNAVLRTRYGCACEMHFAQADRKGLPSWAPVMAPGTSALRESTQIAAPTVAGEVHTAASSHVVPRHPCPRPRGRTNARWRRHRQISWSLRRASSCTACHRRQRSARTAACASPPPSRQTCQRPGPD